MTRILVSLKERSYPIDIDEENSRFITEFKKLQLNPSRIFLVTSAAIKKTGHLKTYETLLKKLKIPFSISVIPNGEQHKNSRTLEQLYHAGIKAGLDRKSVVMALGGGVVTDLAGFFAATYMRGLALISIPTTLLAMVDASIGGKTGIDLAEGKNLIGAFWQPRMVWINPSVLKTLPLREWKTGMAEVVKYGVIKDAKFFHWLEKTISKNRKISQWHNTDIHKAISISAQIKAQVVSSDERELPMAGGREILNFGHTIGHALETCSDYSQFTHGEAISIGMLAAGRIALAQGLWNLLDQQRLTEIFEFIGLPTQFPLLSAHSSRRFWAALVRDKKNISGNLRFVLPVRLGLVQVQSGISRDIVESILQEASC